MKKTIAAIAAGTLLVASQAYATTEAAPRVGDRLGATAGESSEFMGASSGLIFLAVTIVSFALITQINDDSESD